MSEMYHCPECGRELRYQGLCWSCKAEQERRDDDPGHLKQVAALHALHILPIAVVPIRRHFHLDSGNGRQDLIGLFLVHRREAFLRIGRQHGRRAR